MTFFPHVRHPVAPALFAAALLASLMTACAASGPGQPFASAAVNLKTLTPAALAAAQKTETPGEASADKTTLTFRQKTIRLVAVTGPETDMLSYRIAGLRNPALIVLQSATIKLLFVNTDEDMAHDLRFGKRQAASPSVMTSSFVSSVGTSELPHKSQTALHGEELTLRVPGTPGTYAYFCTVRGHAQGGMAGKVIVE